jgi:bifunctional enzyme CysN/CysC
MGISIKMSKALQERLRTPETAPPDKTARALLKSQRPACLWLTGLSGAGKSTVAGLLERRLHDLGRHTYILDGDKMRGGLCADLGFTDADRVEQIRRVCETARMMVDAGLIVIVAVISPFEKERRKARQLFDAGEFIEVFVDTPLAICEERDTKGLYLKARQNKIPNFTGISSPYEAPSDPEITLHCGAEAPDASVEHVMAAMRAFGIIS